MNSREAGRLAGRVAVVTGASGGIGRALAVGLSREHAHVCAIGRNPAALAETVAAIRPFSEVSDLRMDLTEEQAFQPLLQLLERLGRVDILIHSAGVIHQGLTERADVKDLDLQFAANVRAPYVLTQRLLPLLTVARGQVVFINSSAGLAAKRPEVAQYAATKHALRAIADSLREEVNPRGIRVISVYLGRTATPMQKALYKQEGKAYSPEGLLQPEDVASTVIHALMLPATAEVTDISIRPMHRPD